MARIRSIKPEFWTDRKLARLSRDARLLYISMWNHADEHGRLHGDARYIKGHCLPYEDDIDLDDIDALVDELATHGRVQRYDVDDDPYLFLPKLSGHQRLEPGKSASRLPEPPSHSKPPTHDDNPPGKSARNPEDCRPAGSRVHVAGKSSSSPPDGGDGFDEFWEHYPRKVGKQTAVKAYRKALKTTTAQHLLDAVKLYAKQRAGQDPTYTKHPASWLNGGHYDDEPAAGTDVRAPWLSVVERSPSLADGGTPDWTPEELAAP